MLMNFRILVIILLFELNFLLGQTASTDVDIKLQSQDKAIGALKKEIEHTQKEIKSTQKRENTTAKRIANLDKEMSLTAQLINKLARVEKSTKREIGKLEERIPQNERLLQKNLDRYKNRVIEVYKKGSPSDLLKLFGTTSWRQAIYRVRYMKIISEIEKTQQDSIALLLANISKQKAKLGYTLKRNDKAKKDKFKQETLLKKSRKVSQNELKKIRKNKKELAKYLAEKQEGLKQLEAVRLELINDKNKGLREKRIKDQQKYLNSKQFSALKGQLLWPVSGKIITQFGDQWNAKLKTTTDSPGIDIKSKVNAPVRAVHNGVVTTITFIRGFGTTIIIDHGSGFFTVYTHVNNLQVDEDSTVKGRDIIAYTGGSNSANGSKLHFEIWGNQKKLNPEEWLMK